MKGERYTPGTGSLGHGLKRDRDAERKAFGGSILPGGPLTKVLIAFAAVIAAVYVPWCKRQGIKG